jgi:hypothetical protein
MFCLNPPKKNKKLIGSLNFVGEKLAASKFSGRD